MPDIPALAVGGMALEELMSEDDDGFGHRGRAGPHPIVTMPR